MMGGRSRCCRCGEMNRPFLRLGSRPTRTLILQYCVLRCDFSGQRFRLNILARLSLL